MYTAESYPNFYRVVPSEAAFNPARLALLQRFNWTKVGTIYESSPRYSMVSVSNKHELYISIQIPSN
jgi:gaba-B receptor, putative (fragment)